MAQGLFLVRLSNNVHIMLNIWIILLLRFQIKYDTFILQNITFLDKFLIFPEERISSKLNSVNLDFSLETIIFGLPFIIETWY